MMRDEDRYGDVAILTSAALDGWCAANRRQLGPHLQCFSRTKVKPQCSRHVWARLHKWVNAMRNRRVIPPKVVSDLVTASRRRCCVCLALRRDEAEKLGQIAHLDHDPSNNAL